MILMELCQNGALREFLQHQKLFCNINNNTTSKNNKYYSENGFNDDYNNGNNYYDDHDHDITTATTTSLPWNVLIRLCCDISEGIQFLHVHP